MTNDFSLVTSTVENNIIVDDVTVPSGSLAITVNISNNNGFSSSTVNIALGDDCSPITDKNGMLVVENGSVISNSCICGAVSEGFVTVAIASGEDNLSNGDVFTFYAADSASSDAETIQIINTKSEDISTTVKRAAKAATSSGGYYKVGDVDNDGRTDATDSSFVLHALSINDDDGIPIATANANLSYYFPPPPCYV